MTKNIVDEYTIAPISVPVVELVWAQCVPHLQRVVDVSHGELTLESIKGKLMAGVTMMITIAKGPEIVAVNILEVRTFESGDRAMYIPITGGDDLDAWMPRFLELVKVIAKDKNCTRLRGLGVRDGWVRKLRPHGWKKVHTVLEFEIGDE